MNIPNITATTAERIVAGSVLRDPDVLHDVCGSVQSEAFADHPTRLVFETVAKLRDSGR